MTRFLEKVFRLSEHNTSPRREISGGLALGFINYTLIKLIGGRYRDLNLILVTVTIIFIMRFIWIKF